MSSLNNHFTDADLQTVQDGINTFIRLTGLIYDPSPLVWNRWFTDESDLKAALRSVRDAFVNSKRMLGKRKYRGVDFNHVKEIKKDLTTFLTSGKDAGETAHLRKCNLPMYYLVIDPVIDLFGNFDHEESILFAPEIIDGICKMVDDCTNYGTYEQAIEAQLQVRKLMAAREETKKQEQLSKRKKKPKAQDPFLALLASVAAEVDDDLEEDEQDEL
jgi:hypothetical protein